MSESEFPENIDDPRENLPDLSVDDPSDKYKQIEPDDPSDSLPTVSEAFDMAPDRSRLFISTFINIKLGLWCFIGATFLLATGQDTRYIAPLVITGLYFFRNALRKYQTFKNLD